MKTVSINKQVNQFNGKDIRISNLCHNSIYDTIIRNCKVSKIKNSLGKIMAYRFTDPDGSFAHIGKYVFNINHISVMN